MGERLAVVSPQTDKYDTEYKETDEITLILQHYSISDSYFSL